MQQQQHAAPFRPQRRVDAGGRASLPLGPFALASTLLRAALWMLSLAWQALVSSVSFSERLVLSAGGASLGGVQVWAIFCAV